MLEPLDLELQAAADVDAGNLALIPEGQQVLRPQPFCEGILGLFLFSVCRW